MCERSNGCPDNYVTRVSKPIVLLSGTQKFSDNYPRFPFSGMWPTVTLRPKYTYGVNIALSNL